jgi:TM2 domain-containing membrane protein YozV
VQTFEASPRSKGLAIVLALLLGGFGIHRFYLRSYISGVIYLVFFWTSIPAIFGFAESIWFCFMPDTEFDAKYNNGQQINKTHAAVKSVAGVLLILITFIFVAGILAAIVLPAYKDHTDRVRQKTGTSQRDSFSSPLERTSISGAGKHIVAPTNVLGSDLAKVLETKMPVEFPIASWKGQGFGYSERTRIFLGHNNFGTITKADIDQLGVRTSTGQIHEVPKFALNYSVNTATNQELLIFAGLQGTVRLFFDENSNYLELTPNKGDFVITEINGELRNGMREAKALKILHSESAAGGEIAFTYDLNEFRAAIGVALAALGSK